MKPLFLQFVALVTACSIMGAGCTKAVDPAVTKASKAVSLTIWGVSDDENVYDPVITAYHKLHPNVQISYQRLRLEDYEQSLLEAMADERAPDIFLINHEWTGKYLPRITPMPDSTKTAYLVGSSGGLGSQPTWELRTDPTMNLRDYKSAYADAVLQDTLRTVNVATDPQHPAMQERIMGIPVSVDTMALYVNKDLLNAAGIPTPPETWGQFQDQVKKLVKLDPKGNILQAAAGIGTAANVERAADLLSVLMLQNGARMAGPNGTPTFHLIPPELQGQRDFPPSFQALQFYTDFANPAKDTYTWNSTEPNSLEAFIQGKTAFFFGYAYHLPIIQARAPQVNLLISKLPQIEGNPTRNIADYWYWVVSKKSLNQDAAWSFLNFLSQPDQSKKVLALMKRPAARKSLLTDEVNDETVGVFASQVLTAVSWYRGNDARVMENALLELINNSLAGGDPQQIVRFAADKIGQTITY